jgi:hypothetical protein
MRDKFGLQFTIVNSELMAEVRRGHGLHANPFLLGVFKDAFQRWRSLSQCWIYQVSVIVNIATTIGTTAVMIPSGKSASIGPLS